MPRKHVRLWPHNRHSEGCKAIKQLLVAQGINCKRVVSNEYVQRPNHLVINWGNAHTNPIINNCINKPNNINTASNKLLAFGQLKKAEVPHPEFTTDVTVAEAWAKVGSVVARTTLAGSGGIGIHITEKGQPVHRQGTQMWVKYIPKKKEYRVHVFNGKVIDSQEKRKKAGVVERDTRVRNLANGYIFAREDVHLPEGTEQIAINSVKACGLDFGAVDLIWNEKLNQVFVLEVNTAPGCEGTTVERYAQAIKEMLK